MTTESSLRPTSLHEPVGFAGQGGPVLLAREKGNPFLHQPAMPGIEALTLLGAHQLVDARFRKLGYELPGPVGNQGEQFTAHLEARGAESLAAVGYLAIPGKGIDHRLEPGLDPGDRVRLLPPEPDGLLHRLEPRLFPRPSQPAVVVHQRFTPMPASRPRPGGRQA